MQGSLEEIIMTPKVATLTFKNNLQNSPLTGLFKVMTSKGHDLDLQKLCRNLLHSIINDFCFRKFSVTLLIHEILTMIF